MNLLRKYERLSRETPNYQLHRTRKRRRIACRLRAGEPAR